MKFFLTAFLTIVAFVACTKRSVSEVQKDQVDMSSSQIEAYAKDDFDAVLLGKKPIHAVPDAKKPDLSDGGTTFYTGSGYTMVLKSTLTENKGVKGYMYGPIVTFEQIKVDGKPKEMSDVRFYSTEELRKLRGY